MEDLTRYNPEGSDLRRMQLRMLEMLTYVDDICSQHDLKYWLGAGTLLGAVRHGGFIPWDDDLDIELQKDDYNKLIKILSKEPHPDFVIQTHESDNNYVLPFAKLRDKRSIITENFNCDRNYKFKGIFIDIFFLEKGSNFLVRIAVNLQKMPFVMTLIKNDRFGLLISLRNLTYFTIHKILFPLIRTIGKISKNGNYVLPLGTGFNAIRNLQDIFPLSKINFEGNKFNAPGHPDSYLKNIYGAYMELPSEDKRRVHTHQVHFL